MDELTYELLTWLNAGRTVLRPAESTEEGMEAFRGLLMLLTRLRDGGLVQFADRRVTKTEAGMPLMVSPVDLTPKGKAALERDRALGPRLPFQGVHPWRAG
ncbi:hypothetical protein BH24GEM1_BH24GEM1_16480 [soil metagenome]